MNSFWAYFWPPFAIAIAIGVITGLVGFRLKIVRPADRPKEFELHRPPPRQRRVALVGGIAATLMAAALWHGPFGAADRFAAVVEGTAREALDAWEMPKVQAHLHRGPLTRTVVLSGPAWLDDFQTAELARIIETIPGVRSARWKDAAGGPPLFVEGAGVAILGFLLGLLVAYLIELRRRYNAQWTW